MKSLRTLGLIVLALLLFIGESELVFLSISKMPNQTPIRLRFNPVRRLISSL